MTSLSLSVSISDAQAMIRWARAAEAAGLQALWAAEMVHDPFLPLAAVAGHTSRIELGTAIALAFVRSPWVTAVSALDLDMLSGGRFTLGLGTGLKRLNERWHGVAYGKPAPHIKECIQVVRLIMERAHLGEPIRYSGQYYSVDIKGWQRLARSYGVLGEAKMARDAYGHLAKQQPNDVKALADHAGAIARTLAKDAAIPPALAALGDRSRGLDPSHTGALWFTGMARANAGDLDGARKRWTRLLAELDPDSPQYADVKKNIEALDKPRR
jgi:hypothetical protein